MDRSVYENMQSIEGVHWWFRARRSILRDQLRRLNLPVEAAILEVGCGTGGNLSMLSEFGEVTGVEPDDLAREHAARASGRPVLAGLLPDGLPAFERRFDLIAALDVIEHLDDDAGAVAALRGLLAPSGVLFTTVPAHPWLWSRHDELHHHKRRYRMPEYLELIEAGGLKVCKATFFNSVLYPAVVLARAARFGERTGRADDELPSKPVNWMLECAFSSEKHALRAFNLPFGVSLLVIARPA